MKIISIYKQSGGVLFVTSGGETDDPNRREVRSFLYNLSARRARIARKRGAQRVLLSQAVLFE